MIDLGSHPCCSISAAGTCSSLSQISSLVSPSRGLSRSLLPSCSRRTPAVTALGGRWGRLAVRTEAAAAAAAEPAAAETDDPAAPKPFKFVNNYKPKYNKYRSRGEIERSLLREWKDTLGRDGGQEEVNLRNVVGYPFAWLKYNVVPEVLRYAWWLVWVRVLALWARAARVLVLRGASLDVWLAAKGPRRRSIGVQRGRALQRWHGKAPLVDLWYRFRLYRGEEPPVTMPGST